jgi:hypothetical protein
LPVIPPSLLDATSPALLPALKLLKIVNGDLNVELRIVELLRRGRRIPDQDSLKAIIMGQIDDLAQPITGSQPILRSKHSNLRYNSRGYGWIGYPV